MQHPGSDLLRLAGIPEILSQITAGTSGHVHLRVILIVALGTLPLYVLVDLYLSVIAAYMAVIRFRVKLAVLDIVIDKADQFFHGLRIIPEIGNLHIGDGPSQGFILELALKGKFGKGVNRLPHVHMV